MNFDRSWRVYTGAAAMLAALTIGCRNADPPRQSEAATPSCAGSPTPIPKDRLLSPDTAALRAVAPDSFRVQFETSKGCFTVMAHRDWSPNGVDRFHYLVSNGFYDDVRFFRVLPGFMAQFGISGDPKITAAWTDRGIPDDPVKMGNKRGRVTFAMSSLPNSRTTQLFINFVDNDRLDGMGFAAIGEVTDGMSVVDSIFGGYGETPDQGALSARGNEYLAGSYPQLDYVKTARIIP